jgi:DNA replication ATP-dependent helicase Dna2
MQGQEADAVLVSYGVADQEYAAMEAEFLYGRNRLNVAITRARCKSIVFLPKPLLDGTPGLLDNEIVVEGLAYMRKLVDVARCYGATQKFDLEGNITLEVHRFGHVARST